MNPSDALIVLVGLVVVLVFVGWWRLTNATVSLTWASRTTRPEPSNPEIEEARRRVSEMDHARGQLEVRERELAELEKKYGG